ncbi:hypothetical protein BGZ99_010421 [Dissophora globulifera]|uniref:RING-type domain-containing protein n=1 Tax=Dissophora globulifera TaxID=979702 RepID=A0A9P6UM48_9FUNG|nr:hypothetical protein BGZ99_010421 [Dissophora globulifera]
MSTSHLSIASPQGNTRAPSILSRHSSRAPSIQHVAATAAALMSSPDGRQLRINVYSEMLRGWFDLSTSSKLLLTYYITATALEVVTTVTVAIIERKAAAKCFYLLIFLGLYLVRSIVISGLLLRRYLYERPDDLPRTFSGACGAHYKTMVNWASLILILFSISLLTTQTHCVKDAPGLFYLVLVFSLIGYLCLAMLLLLWFVVLFCLNGVVAVLELFGVGPRVMQWQGATQEMLDDIPIIKYTNYAQSPLQSDHFQAQVEKDATAVMMPSIVVSEPMHREPSTSAQNRDSVIIVVEPAVDTIGVSPTPSALPTIHIAQASDDERPGHALELGPLEQLDEPEQLKQLSPEERKLAGRISTSCSICLCDYEDLEELRHLPCDHYFHKECVDEWLKLKRTCPLCTYDISPLSPLCPLSKFLTNTHNTAFGISTPPLTLNIIFFKVSVEGLDETHLGIGSLSSATLHTSTSSNGHHHIVNANDDDDDDDEGEGTNTAGLTSAWTEMEEGDHEDEDPTSTHRARQHQPTAAAAAAAGYLANKHQSSRFVRRILDPLQSLSSIFSSTISTSTTPPAPSSYTLVSGGGSGGEGGSSSISRVSTEYAAQPEASSSSSSTRVRPTASDGVFANISAKPEVEGQKNNELQPPTYDSAVQDITPPYFEMAVASPNVFGNEILVEGIPVGTLFQFFWNVAVAVSFQFLGVLLTYLLHNSHASKAGSMVGLGLTMVNFGIRMRGGLGAMFGNTDDNYNNPNVGPPTLGSAGEITNVDKNYPVYVDDTGYVSEPDATYGSDSGNVASQMEWFDAGMENHWVSLILMITGWLIIVKALAEYATAKRTERIMKALSAEDPEAGRVSIEYFTIEHNEM